MFNPCKFITWYWQAIGRSFGWVICQSPVRETWFIELLHYMLFRLLFNDEKRMNDPISPFARYRAPISHNSINPLSPDEIEFFDIPF